MANKDDYFTTYREFFEYFAQTVNPNDQLPVKLGSYKLLNVEVIGGIIDWTTQYLAQKGCPPYLFSPLIKIIIEEIRKACKKHPFDYGFSSTDNAYEPLKLMQAVMAKTNEVCLRYLDNSMLCSLPIPSGFYFKTSICAVRNRRRKMEDRHVAIHDLNTMFSIQEASPSSYYAIFDGHAGHDAAAYSAAHLHQFLAENKYFISNPEQALLDAFCKTDALFLEKCKVENLSGGTTAVVALLRPKVRTLYIAWVGDSQALLVKQGKVLQCVNPHKPCREDERERIEKAGGSVMLWGTWRVNGQLAVSRAIGDADYKPHVIAIPDVREISLDGEEDFLIIACDGLWDFLTEDVAAQEVYYMIAENPDDTERISNHLVQLARYQGSTDNISVIVVFLREPHQISSEAHRWATSKGPILATSNMETGLDNANNPFTNSNGSLKNLNVDSDNINIPKANDGLLLDLTDNFKNRGDLSQDIFVSEKSNGTKMSSPGIHFDDDFGPETDVDAVDDAYPHLEKDEDFGDGLSKVLKDESNLKSIKNEVKAINEELVNNNPLSDEFNPFLAYQKNENINEDSKELDFEGFHTTEDNRGETPTPSAVIVHDAGGLDVNIGESDSEDEWNYIKGDQAKPETLSSQPETVVETSEQDDTMSQLNPNAAEFVPISPTRSIPSPACRALLDEEIISESPKRPVRVDIKVPSEVEFESEVKSRPSDFDKNGHDDELDDGARESDKIENLLNGKNIDEIPEFHPGSTPSKLPSEEFHFGPNAAPFTPRVLDQSEAFSTKANYGDDTEQTLNTSFNDSELSVQNKEQTDPMSMSFYAEKGESNPFQDDEDLNKVHRLPENIDEFLQEDIDSNKENSILNKPADSQQHKSDEKLLDNDQATIQTTDLDKISQDDEKELASPLEDKEDLLDVGTNEDVCTKDFTSKSPDLLDDFVVVAQKSEEKQLADDSNLALLPELEPINANESKSEHETQLQDFALNPTHLEVETALNSSSPIHDEEKKDEESSSVSEKAELGNNEKGTLNVEEVLSASPIELDKSSPLPGEHEILHARSPTPEKTNIDETEELLKDNLQEKEILVQADIHQSQSPTCELRFDTKSPTVDNEQSSLNAAFEVSSPSPASSDVRSPVPDETPDINQPQSTSPEITSHVEFEELSKDHLQANAPAHTNVDQVGESHERQECRSPICELRPESKSPVDFEGSKSPICELSEAPTETMESALNPKSEVESIYPEAKEQSSIEALAVSPVPACEYSAEPELCDLAGQDADIRESHSPMDLLEHKQEEEITSSVKDDVSSPIEQLSPVKSPEPLVEESIKAVDSALENIEPSETHLQDESKIEAHSQSVTMIEDVLSCPRPVSNSPIEPEAESKESNLVELATTEEAGRPPLTNGLDYMTSEFSEPITIKTEQITMEFAESAVITPSEESKAIDESVPLLPTQSEVEIPVELQQAPVSEPEPIQAVQPPEPTESIAKVPEETTVPVSIPVVQVTPLEVKEEVKAEGKKSPAPSAAKKPVGKVEPRKSTGPSKVGAVKASPKPATISPKPGDASKVPPKTGTTKPATTTTRTAPTPASKLLTKPKTAPPAKPAEKKPIAKTEVKPAARTTLAKKPTEAPASKTTTRPVGSVAKTSPTKTTAPRPTTAPSTTASKTSTAPPRPITAKPRLPLTSKTTTTTATSTATASKSSSATTNVKTTTTSRTVSMPKTTSAPPKPRTITSAAPKPRVPLTKTVTKSADLEKEKKESANKLTASRSSSGPKTSGVAANKTTTVKKTEIKSSTDRSVTSKTSATSKTTSVIRKSGEVKTSTKTKTTKIEKPKLNGVAPTTVTEEIKETTCYNAVNESESENLVKDNSPLDNKLLIETSNALIDVNPAD